MSPTALTMNDAEYSTAVLQNKLTEFLEFPLWGDLHHY